MHAVLCQPISWLAIHEKTKSVHPMLIKFCAVTWYMESA